ncbi:MAG: hypothetical protein AAF848_17070 [Pseudomonadota bacterium]
MTLPWAIAVVAAAAGALYMDIVLNDAALIGWAGYGFIGVLEWLAFWR